MKNNSSRKILEKVKEYINAGDINAADKLLSANIEMLRNNEEAVTLYICFKIYREELKAGEEKNEDNTDDCSIFDCVSDADGLIRRYTLIKFMLRRLEFDKCRLNSGREQEGMHKSEEVKKTEGMQKPEEAQKTEGMQKPEEAQKPENMQKNEGALAEDEKAAMIIYDNIIPYDITLEEFVRLYRVSEQALKITAGYSAVNKEKVLKSIDKLYGRAVCGEVSPYKTEKAETDEKKATKTDETEIDESKRNERTLKICFIICTNNNMWLNECLLYINTLKVPEGTETDTITIEGAEFMTEGYNAAMNASDADYKVYMHQDVFIVNENFIQDLADIFSADENIGIIGMAGSLKLPDSMVMWDSRNRIGALYCCNVVTANEYRFDIPVTGKYAKAEAVDGLLIATSKDIKWREDIIKGWDFYDVSQCMEFAKQGFDIVVPYQKKPWCVHDDGFLNLENYKYWQAVCRREYGWSRQLLRSMAGNSRTEFKANILFLDWNCYGKEDIAQTFIDMGHNVEPVRLELKSYRKDEEFTKALKNKLRGAKYDFIFSLNYYPAVSISCMECRIPYISWVYDSPQVVLYSQTIMNPCNYVFLFDETQYNELKELGAKTVYYLPLAVNGKRLRRLHLGGMERKEYKSDISFVGSLYNESHNLYQRLEEKIDARTRKKLWDIVRKQQKIYTKFIMEDCIDDELLKVLHEAMPVEKAADALESDKYTYANYFLGRRLAELERTEILSMLSDKYNVKLYTFNKPDTLPNVNFMGKVDYYTQMPYVFYNSRINLNITLRTIKSGVSLRAWDILGSGGFLMTNYQADLRKILVPGEDYAEYSSYEQLMELCEYFLSHENDRIEIAKNGFNKVISEHTYQKRLELILKIFTDSY